MSRTCREAVAAGAALLRNAGVPDAEFDALQLFCSAAGLDPTGYALEKDAPAAQAAEAVYRGYLDRRAAGEPLQYILGVWDFYRASFAVGPGVLIPRPETEELTDLCVREVRARGCKTVYDLCAGSGCIGISVAAACPSAEIYLFEKYDAAFTYLKKNADAAGTGRLHPVRRDLFDGPDPALPAPELIVSNPPYIPSAELPSLQREVLREPETALDGGADGLAFYRCIARLWFPVLAPGGMLAAECGEGQAASIAELFPGRARILTDAFGVDRFVTVRKEERI